MAKLFYQDNKRYHWLLKKLNMPDYKLKESYEYKRQTRYDKHIADVKTRTRQARLDKLNKLREEFERQKVDFFKEKELMLNKIQQEIKTLGFTEIEFPKFDYSQTQK